MGDSTLKALRAAIARNSAAVLTLPSAGMVRHCKTRFLADDQEGFWIESDQTQGPLLDELIFRGADVGISFKTGAIKTIFTTPIVCRQSQYRLNAELTVEALRLRFPDKVTAVQRRANYRVSIPNDSELVVRVWRIPEHWVLRDRPSATMEVGSQARDLSMGGVGLQCPPKDGEQVRMVADCRLRVLLSYSGTEVLVEGRVRHVRPTPDHSQRVGVQFRKLQDDLAGRQALSMLTTIVGDLHREELRRLRLGMAD